VKSQARRPILGQEFVALHELLKQHDGTRRNRNQGDNVHWKRHGKLAMVNFQFHLIACVDDSYNSTHTLEHIHVHNNFPNCLNKTRLNWSKNVNEKTDAPWQIGLGSITSFCMLCPLAL
jgi:hypothetical protein